MGSERYIPPEARIGPSESEAKKAQSEPDTKKDQPSLPSRRQFIKAMSKSAAALGVVGISGVELKAQQTETEQKEGKDPEVEKIIRDSWRKIKEVLNDKNFEENINYIRQELGEVGDRVTYKARFDLLSFKTLEKEEKEGVDIFNDPDLRKILIESINDFDMLWNSEMIKSRAERNRGTISFEGFEQLPKVEKQALLDKVEKVFGREWVYGTVDKIVYVPEERSGMTFRLGGEAVGRDLTSAIVKDNKQTIFVYKSDNLTQKNFESLLAHEFAHHNDWIGSHNLTIPERVEFLRDILDRLKGNDAQGYDYVQNTIPREGQAGNWTPEEIRYTQAIEYWSMICEDYFNGSDGLKQFGPKDHALVEKWKGRINQVGN